MVFYGLLSVQDDSASDSYTHFCIRELKHKRRILTVLQLQFAHFHDVVPVLIESRRVNIHASLTNLLYRLPHCKIRECRARRLLCVCDLITRFCITKAIVWYCHGRYNSRRMAEESRTQKCQHRVRNRLPWQLLTDQLNPRRKRKKIRGDIVEVIHLKPLHRALIARVKVCVVKVVCLFLYEIKVHSSWMLSFKEIRNF